MILLLSLANEAELALLDLLLPPVLPPLPEVRGDSWEERLPPPDPEDPWTTS